MASSSNARPPPIVTSSSAAAGEEEVVVTPSKGQAAADYFRDADLSKTASDSRKRRNSLTQLGRRRSLSGGASPTKEDRTSPSSGSRRRSSTGALQPLQLEPVAVPGTVFGDPEEGQDTTPTLVRTFSEETPSPAANPHRDEVPSPLRLPPNQQQRAPSRTGSLKRNSMKMTAVLGPADGRTLLSAIRSVEPVQPVAPRRRSSARSPSVFGGNKLSRVQALGEAGSGRRRRGTITDQVRGWIGRKQSFFTGGGDFEGEGGGDASPITRGQIKSLVRAPSNLSFVVDDGGGSERSPSMKMKRRIKSVKRTLAVAIKGGSRSKEQDGDAGEDEDAEIVPYTLHPKSPLKEAWSGLILTLVVYNAIVLPLDIAFFESWAIPEEIDTLDYFLDSLFIADVVINLRTGYFEKDGSIVYDTRKIAYHYLTGWGLIDIPASIPFELIAQGIIGKSSTATGGTGQALKLVKLFKASRLLRFGRIVRFLRVVKLPPALASAGKIVFLMLMFFYASHFCGCFFYALNSLEQVEASWTWAYGVNRFQDVSPSEQWTSVLFAAFLMLVGENMDPKTPEEQGFAIVVMLFGAMLYATMFSQIAILIGTMNRSRSRYNEHIADVNEHMRNLQLPLNIQDRVLLYFNELWELNRCLDREAFFGCLSPALKAEICLWLYGETVQEVPFLRRAAPDFIVRLAQSLTSAQFLPGDYVLREGEIGAEMYFLRMGRCDVLKKNIPGKILATLKKGAFFGEIAIMVSNIRRTAMIRAATFCDVAVLSHASFEVLMKDFPDDGDKLVFKEGIRARVRRQMKAYKDVEGVKALRALEHQISIRQRWKAAAKKASEAAKLTLHLRTKEPETAESAAAQAAMLASNPYVDAGDSGRHGGDPMFGGGDGGGISNASLEFLRGLQGLLPFDKLRFLSIP